MSAVVARTLAALAVAATLAPSIARAQTPPEGPARVDVEAGALLLGRHLAYTDDVLHALDTFDLGAAPGLYARASVFPGAFTRSRVAAMFGVYGGVEAMLNADSVDARGAVRPLHAYAGNAGLRVRLPFANPDVGVEVGWFTQRFTVGPTSPRDDGGIPDLALQGVSAGLAGRVNLGARWAVTARASYLAVLSAGDARRVYFPRETLAGIVVAAGFVVRLPASLEARVEVEYRRIFTSMHPEVGDAFVAGGALDQFLAVRLGIAFRR